MTPTELEARLAWYFRDAEYDLGKTAAALEAWSSTQYRHNTNLPIPDIEAAAKERKVRLALAPLMVCDSQAWHRTMCGVCCSRFHCRAGCLWMCYAPVSPYMVGPDLRATARHGKRDYGLIDGLCRVKSKDDRDTIHRAVDRAHEAFFASWEARAAEARAELESARASGQAKRVAMLLHERKRTRDSIAWGDAEIVAWRTVIDVAAGTGT